MYRDFELQVFFRESVFTLYLMMVHILFILIFLKNVQRHWILEFIAKVIEISYYRVEGVDAAKNVENRQKAQIAERILEKFFISKLP